MDIEIVAGVKIIVAAKILEFVLGKYVCSISRVSETFSSVGFKLSLASCTTQNEVRKEHSLVSSS